MAITSVHAGWRVLLRSPFGAQSNVPILCPRAVSDLQRRFAPAR